MEHNLPTEVIFGNRKLRITEDITNEELAHLSVVLSFATAGVLIEVDQTRVNSWLEEMKVSRLFVGK